MGTKSDRPSVYDYLNFRAYLKDYIQYYKSENAAFTYRVLAEEFGFKSRSHYIDIVKGRTLTPRYIHSYIKFCGLNKKEAEYFRALVGYNQAKSDTAKSKLFNRIIACSPNLETVQLENEAYQYFAKWYQPVMISILDLNRKENDHRKIAKKFNPPISAVQAKHAIKELVKLGFISWNDTQKRWEFHHKFFKCTDDARVLALKKFHRQMMDLGISAYKKDFKQQTFSTLTLSVSDRVKTEIDEMIADLRKRILDKIKSDTSPETVLQVNFQTFELAKRSKKAKQRKT
ncbi:MAG: TIGR02147 family protein [Chitinivibrionales bacterium]|nr:TIGR02147 family protein [Chitinivibrionales bacterium]